jgi:MFS family permease
MMAVLTDSKQALVVGIIVAGAFLGINNTVITEAVMGAAPVERPVASAAYSFVRFGGGAIAPYAAGKLGENVSVHAPFWMGAAAVAVAVSRPGRRAPVPGGRAASHGRRGAGRGRRRRRRQLTSAAAVGLQVGGAHLLRSLRGGHLVERAP